jgi:hypothetical protein
MVSKGLFSKNSRQLFEATPRLSLISGFGLTLSLGIHIWIDFDFVIQHFISFAHIPIHYINIYQAIQY